MAFSKICILGQSLINKIAAGEVVESGASIVKELLDNALDAGAARIRVEFSAGGRQSIRVSDDGIGMSPEDSLLCFERHATSKIRAFEDLSALTSCGFRGEALAAIAAISKITLITCDGTECRRVRLEGGKVMSSTSDARQRGTSIEVTHLFYNTPVRAEFRPSLAKESADIAAVFTQVALANPSVGFELWKNGHELYGLPPCSKELPSEFLLRIEQLLGRAYAENLLFFQCGQDLPKFWGYLAKPSHDRPNRSGQYLAINSKPIQSMPIGAAIAQGYGARLAPRRFPCFVLNGHLPPGDVDFNVHPQKKEIRLRCAGQLLFWISNGVDARFLQTFHRPDDQPLGSKSLPWDRAQAQSAQLVPEDELNAKDGFLTSSENQRIPRFSPKAETLVELKPLQRHHCHLPDPAQPPPKGEHFVLNDHIWSKAVKAIWSPYLLLDTAPLFERATALLAERSDATWWAVHLRGGWLMIDYPKAAAWVHAARALADRPAARQLLMQPLQLQVSQESAELLSAYLEELEVWGLSLARTALREFACLAIPQTLECSAHTLGECLEQWARFDQSAARARFMARWLANQPWQCSSTISGETAQYLVNRVLQAAEPPRTAKGDAIATPLFREDLAKFFKTRG